MLQSMQSKEEQVYFPPSSLSFPMLTSPSRYYTVSTLPPLSEIFKLHTAHHIVHMKALSERSKALDDRLLKNHLLENERIQLKARRRELKRKLRRQRKEAEGAKNVASERDECPQKVKLKLLPRELRIKQDPVNADNVFHSLTEEEKGMELEIAERAGLYLRHQADILYAELMEDWQERELLSNIKGMNRVSGVRQLKEAIEWYERVKESQFVRDNLRSICIRKTTGLEEDEWEMKVKLAHAKMRLAAVEEICAVYDRKVDFHAALALVRARRAKEEKRMERLREEVRRVSIMPHLIASLKDIQKDNDIQESNGYSLLYKCRETFSYEDRV
ncbi:hypothetical protein BJ508DRAFT_313687 [Ascobolus immersus RN42]|uniref:Uncharacterized protein n=1 Tax=Ascobolus immersus RN42 TaxID=1160509 RepID=A0A3N4HM38_ASCIM|nr:hypothetical protein BJ508DRAFT_313687 [Ascobolus immersus RN42]